MKTDILTQNGILEFYHQLLLNNWDLEAALEIESDKRKHNGIPAWCHTNACFVMLYALLTHQPCVIEKGRLPPRTNGTHVVARIGDVYYDFPMRVDYKVDSRQEAAQRGFKPTQDGDFKASMQESIKELHLDLNLPAYVEPQRFGFLVQTDHRLGFPHELKLSSKDMRNLSSMVGEDLSVYAVENHGHFLVNTSHSEVQFPTSFQLLTSELPEFREIMSRNMGTSKNRTVAKLIQAAALLLDSKESHVARN